MAHQQGTDVTCPEGFTCGGRQRERERERLRSNVPSNAAANWVVNRRNVELLCQKSRLESTNGPIVPNMFTQMAVGGRVLICSQIPGHSL
jgi:hypothetical protein